jgi:hypothetical protein
MSNRVHLNIRPKMMIREYMTHSLALKYEVHEFGPSALVDVDETGVFST